MEEPRFVWWASEERKPKDSTIGWVLSSKEWKTKILRMEWASNLWEKRNQDSFRWAFEERKPKDKDSFRWASEERKSKDKDSFGWASKE
ncbi:uncharacterized protein OCT59_028198 [Rhizophagus irregularis]|uniref:uncharacterized protein n=1 Tax=Rhizophagus irregularis TaxID=588596 RepID=UPI0033231A65|nr:hypothetical protein OCT59_028198 [Rhizophagus irregularis]